MVFLPHLSNSIYSLFTHIVYVLSHNLPVLTLKVTVFLSYFREMSTGKKPYFNYLNVQDNSLSNTRVGLVWFFLIM